MEVSGSIASDPDVRENRVTFLLRVSGARSGLRVLPACGRASVELQAAGLEGTRLLEELEYGRKLVIRGRVSLPRGPERPGGFSLRDYLQRQGAFCLIRTTPRGVTPLNAVEGAAPVRWAYRVRNALMDMLRLRLPEKEAGLVAGMLLGSYTPVPQDLRESFTRTGTLHLLAASGFNCALIVAIFWHALLRRRGPRVPSVILVMLALGFYVLMAGGKPSILRAGVGACLYLGAILAGRPTSVSAVLFATALAILAWKPLALADVGFQLSFAAVGGIVLFVPPVQKRLFPDSLQPRHTLSPARRALRAVARSGADVAIVTCAATLSTLPIIAHYFGRVSLVSLPANCAVAALAEWLFIAGVAQSAFFWVPGLDQALTYAVHLLAAMVAWIVQTLGALPFAEARVSPPGPAAMALYYACLLLGWRLIPGVVTTSAARAHLEADDPFAETPLRPL